MEADWPKVMLQYMMGVRGRDVSFWGWHTFQTHLATGPLWGVEQTPLVGLSFTTVKCGCPGTRGSNAPV